MWKWCRALVKGASQKTGVASGMCKNVDQWENLLVSTVWCDLPMANNHSTRITWNLTSFTSKTWIHRNLSKYHFWFVVLGKSCACSWLVWLPESRITKFRGMWLEGNHRIHGAAIYGNMDPIHTGMDQYLWKYMKIPFLVGWTSINPSYDLMWTKKGYKVLTHSHIPPMLAYIPAPWIRHGKVHCPLLWHRFATTHCMQHVAYVLTQAHGFWAREWDPLIFPKGLVLARTSTLWPVIRAQVEGKFYRNLLILIFKWQDYVKPIASETSWHPYGWQNMVKSYNKLVVDPAIEWLFEDWMWSSVSYTLFAMFLRVAVWILLKMRSTFK